MLIILCLVPLLVLLISIRVSSLVLPRSLVIIMVILSSLGVSKLASLLVISSWVSLGALGTPSLGALAWLVPGISISISVAAGDCLLILCQPVGSGVLPNFPIEELLLSWDFP